MVNAYLISYDLDKPGQNYGRLERALQEFGAVRVLFSQWVLKSKATAAQLRDHFQKSIDTNDRLLVTEVGDWASYNTLVKVADALAA